MSIAVSVSMLVTVHAKSHRSALEEGHPVLGRGTLHRRKAGEQRLCHTIDSTSMSDERLLALIGLPSFILAISREANESIAPNKILLLSELTCLSEVKKNTSLCF